MLRFVITLLIVLLLFVLLLSVTFNANCKYKMVLLCVDAVAAAAVVVRSGWESRNRKTRNFLLPS